MQKNGLLGIIAIMILGLWGVFSSSGAAPLSSSDMTARALENNEILQKAHGFHCRAELGWNPRTGVYERHSHMGICKNYKRCLEVHHRCILVLGRGWDSWKYERWGDDNWRYTNCMLERGCY